MSSPKKKHGPASGGTYGERAARAWGAIMPDWITILAAAADAEAAKGGSLRTLGDQIDLSAASLSAVLGNKYPARTDKMEAMVRGHLMSATVTCPVQGEIGRDACKRNQERPFSAANPVLVRLYRTCPGCDHFLGKKP